MIPVRLKLQGFLSYREPVELDFTGFDLACISGENGAGKSSLLDAITWALFGRARKADESVINTHPEVKKAEVTLDFDYEGNRYRVVRTNPRGKTSSVELFIRAKGENDEEQWNTLSERTLRDTDAKIVETLRMDYDTFTNASFFLQGKADQFATARPGDRKQILSNILGLEIWETYREAAAQRRRETDQKVKGLDGRLSEIQAELDDEPRRMALLAELQEKLKDLTARTQERAKAYENVQKLQAVLNEQQKLVATLQNQLDQAEKTFERTRTTLAERRQEQADNAQMLARAEDIEKAYADWQAARKSLEEMEELADQFRQHEALRHEPLAAIRAEEARLTQELEGLTEQQTALEKAQKESAVLEEQLAGARTQVESLQARLMERQQLDEAIRQLQADQAEAKAENPRLRDEMNELKDRIDQLSVADGAECPLCGQPLAEHDKEVLVAALSAKGTSLGDRFRENKQLLENFESQLRQMGAQLADLKGVEAELREVTRRADQLTHQLDSLQAQRTQWEQTGAARLMEIGEI
ncbi:MAG: SMC family ATPase, partial [Anaerolineaceae bacterium]|nr:SMC family ATPase [Anaerolineaceae bacterium]